MTNAVVLVTSRSFSSGEVDLAGELTGAGCEIRTGPADHDLDVLGPMLASATAWVAGTGPVTADHLDAAPDLRLVARYGVGVEAVDLAAAADRGVLVTNTPGANTGAVADLAVALMLAALRDVSAGDRRVRAGQWTVRRSRELGHLSVGIVGLGRIGRGVAARLRGFGSTLLGYDPWVAPKQLGDLGITPVSLSELARRSDVITLHAPGAAVVVDEAFLALTRDHLVLVNTARAGLVDEAAVAGALRAGSIRIYATDVLGTEVGAGPAAGLGESEREPNPLLAEDLIERTLFTPHTGAQTVEAVDRMGRGAVDAVLAVLRGEQPANLVRVPAPLPGGAA